MSEQAAGRTRQAAGTAQQADGGHGQPDGVPPFRYDARLAADIEQRWQRRWAADATFNAPNPAGELAAGFEQVAGKPKYYVLDMFPAPSGTGIHVGHLIGYVGTDVFARFLRMTGYNVLHSMGYDAFGLPAEQYALATGQHPRVTTQQNIAIMRGQLRRLGMAYDERRGVETTDPAFYRWTQWIFLQLFGSWVDERTGTARPITGLVAEYESGTRATPDGRPWASLTAIEQRQLVDDRRLAYISEQLVNWCPGLGTVLANEEVTADGRSDIGNFPVYRRPLRQWMMRITSMAGRLAGDLDLVEWPESIKQLQRNWIGASDGAVIWLSPAGNAAGAAAGDGPAPVEVFTTRPDTLPGATYVVLAPEHPQADSLVPDAWPEGTPEAWRYPAARPAAGPWRPADAVAAYRQAASRLSDRQRAVESQARSGVFTGGYLLNPATGEPIPVFLADYVLMGYGTGAIMAVPEHDERDAAFAAQFGLPERAVGAGLGDITGAIARLAEAGTGRAARSYRLRDWLFSRQRYWGEPFPIVYDESGLPVALPADELPVLLPEMADFQPATGTDEASMPVPPLARVPGWADVTLNLGDGPKPYRRELNTMPQWAGSCWYYLRYLDPDDKQALVDPELDRYWMAGPPGAPAGVGGVDLYVGGAEHAVLHLLYARFWHKVLFDLGYVSTPEPFRQLVNQGMIQADAFTDDRGIYVPAAEVTTGADGTPRYHGQPVRRRIGKMGKSLKNGVSPDDVYARYGADTLRLYEMSMGPLETEKPWQDHDMVGAHRFLQRLWRCLVSEQTGELTAGDGPLDEAARRQLHATIAVVRHDFSQLRFNTAIARLTELTTTATRIAAQAGGLPRELAEPLVLMVAPLAPHVAEELWAMLGHQESLAYAPFPAADPRLAGPATVPIPVQVDGKTRFTIEVPAEATAADIERQLAEDTRYRQWIAERAVSRLVIVPGRIVNAVTSG